MSTESSGTSDAAAVRLEIMPNGPLRLSGKVEIVDASGDVVFEGDKTALCRCGLSANKPFCDGTHRKESWSEKS